MPAMPALINTVCPNVIEIVLNKLIHYVLDDVVWSIKEKIYVRQCNEKNFFCFEVDARCKLFMLHFYQPSSLLSTLNFIYGVVCRGFASKPQTHLEVTTIQYMGLRRRCVVSYGYFYFTAVIHQVQSATH